MYTSASAEEETLLTAASSCAQLSIRFYAQDALQTMSPPWLISHNDVDHVARVQTYLKRVERDIAKKTFSYYKKRDSQTRVWLNLIKDIRSVN